MNKPRILLIAGALALALGMFGCGAPSQVSDEPVPQNFQEGPAWRIVSTTAYTLDGGRYYKERNSYDDYGNLLVREVTFAAGETSTSEYSGYDEYGYYSSVVADGTETTYEWTVEDGHAVAMTSSAGASVAYEYHPNGALSATHSTIGETAFEYTYNDAGRPVVLQSDGGDNDFKIEYKWEVDEQGRLTGCNVDTSYLGDNDFTFELDENGNVVRILNDEGGLYREFEYARFDNPSNQARIEAKQIPLP